MATQNLEQVRNLLDKMADLRTRAPSEINIITMEWIQTTLKCLKTVKIHLQTQQKSFDINNELLDKFSDIGHTYVSRNKRSNNFLNQKIMNFHI